MGHIPTVIKIAPMLLVHTTVQITCHFLFTMGVGKLFKIPFRELVLASNANVGGPTTGKLYIIIQCCCFLLLIQKDEIFFNSKLYNIYI